MARGAPDHIRLSDDAHSRYTWKWKLAGSQNCVSGVPWDCIDEKFEGILISFSSYCEYKSTRYKIYVDDILIQELRPEVQWESHKFRHPDSGFDITGISMYDEVNDKYALWWQSHFKCYVRKSVKVEAWQGSGGLVWIKYPMIYYLERS